MPTQDYRFIEIHFKMHWIVPSTDPGICPVLSNNLDTMKCDKQGSHFGSVESEIPLHIPNEEQHLHFFQERNRKQVSKM